MTLKKAAAGRYIFTALVFFLLSGLVHAACDAPVGKFVSITGAVGLQSTGGSSWSTAKLETPLCEGDTIRVGERSRAAVSLVNNAVLRIDQNTAIRLIDITPQDEETSLLDLFRGAFQSFSRKPKYLRVNTPYLNGSVEGTEFVFRVTDDEAVITVLEGVVLASNTQGEVAIRPGESAVASSGQAPQRRIVVKPRDLVQWGLYYPPVLSTAGLVGASPAIEKAANCAANRNTACAFSALEAIPQAQRDANYLLLRASVLLSVGRVDEARTEIEAAVQRNDKASAAYALRAVIGVAQNDTEAALADARRSVELDPQSAAAKIALSYALQANLKLVAARDTLLQAVEQEPKNALAWARLAEVHLMEGYLKESRVAAERAVALQPGLSRTQNVLGFAALSEIRAAQAQATFEKAIQLDSADPMPHLGLGLAKIRQGNLDEGGADLEAAVALDSNNALLRAYLGKAYFEEKRGPLDATQFEVAKELDPLDPTAYFYNAIRLQTENQPVDALREIEASIERNDNRAVYRSRLLLDRDRAARGVSQARIVSDLGFSQLGINESTESLGVDPGNAAAHRFLADTYQGVRRREVARVSEFLQSQMLQDVNINPVQPSISEANLNIVTQGGPATPGYNEYTPLFERNRASALVSGMLGNNDTGSGEVVVSGVYDGFSASAGAFYYDTDGWRPNNNLRQDVENVFGQWAISPQFNVQAEYRQRESKEGDLAFNFDPDDFMSDKTIKRDTKTARVGLRFSPSPNSDVLFSYINNERTEDSDSSRPDDLFGLADFGVRLEELTKTDDDGNQYEGQYLWQSPKFNVIAGAAYSEVDRDYEIELSAVDTLGMFGPPGGSFPVDAEKGSEDIDHGRGYLYANVSQSDSLLWTLGVSYEDFTQQDFDLDGFYPKLGLRWQFNEALTFRAAAFKVMKPVLVSNRTLEPTQIAGFNQFFDDINATESIRYAGGIDWTVNSQLKLGGELTWRYLDEPVFVGSDAVTEDREEEYHRLYAYWTPTSDIAVNAEIVYDLYKSDDGIATAFDNLPERVRTVSLPVGVRYFRPSGFFAGVVGTYVDQKVERSATATQADGDDQFFLVDASIGYRLPKRRGTISLGVMNIFDSNFNYQDDSYREFRDEPSTGPYFPDRTIMGQLTLSF